MEATRKNHLARLTVVLAAALMASGAQALGLSLDSASASLRPLTESRLGLKTPGALTEGVWNSRTASGQSFTLGGLALSPYIGLGYRALPQDGGTLAYIPLGLSHRVALGPQGQLSTQLEYKHLFEGGASLGNLRAAPAGGHGLRLSSTYETRDWSVGLFYQQWRLRAGSAGGLGLYSPTLGADSGDTPGASSEYGVQLKYRY